jgi:hypothetical protein
VVLRALGQIVFAIRSSGFEPRVRRWTALVDTSIHLEPLVRTRRLFSRPPPLGLHFV